MNDDDLVAVLAAILFAGYATTGNEPNAATCVERGRELLLRSRVHVEPSDEPVDERDAAAHLAAVATADEDDDLPF